MLPRQKRLRKEKDFRMVFKKALVIRGGLVTLRAKKNGSEKLRFGVVVSKKIAKKAVARNRLKRRAREVLRKTIPYIKPGYDIVIVFNLKADRYDVIKKNIFEALGNAGLLTTSFANDVVSRKAE